MGGRGLIILLSTQGGNWYWLGAYYAGLGVMIKVTQKIMEYGFVEASLNKIEIRCADKNYKSKAIPERLGFSYEASLR